MNEIMDILFGNASVIVNISHEKVDRAFQYRIPQDLWEVVEAGTCVQVPFGASNKLIKGYVIRITTECNWDRTKIKDIHSIQSGYNRGNSYDDGNACQHAHYVVQII